jgi:hypothetical protein
VGVLTDTTMRLRKEMVALRHMRVALRSDLVRQTDERRTQVSALCAGFASDRAGAHRAWFGSTLFEGRTAGTQPQRRPVEAAKAKTQMEQQAPATPKVEPPRHEAAKPVSAPVAQPPIALSPRAGRRPFKGSKKH